MMASGNKHPAAKSNMITGLAYGIVAFFILLGIIAPILSNEKPLRIQTSQGTYWPVLNNVNWQRMCDAAPCQKIFAPIGFSPNTLDPSASRAQPGAKSVEYGSRHILGTDAYGRDVLAIIIHGSRTAIWISLLAVGLAFLIGICYGMFMGYYGRDRIRLYPVRIFLNGIIWLLAIAGLVFIHNLSAASLLSPVETAVFIVLVCFAAVLLMRIGSRMIRADSRYRMLDVDSIGMRLVDLIKALPPLFIVLFALQLIDVPNVWYLIFLIAFLLWATFARHARAETLRLRAGASVQKALLTGRSDLWIWRHEILPFIIRPLLVTVAFSIAAAVLLEATLSFLGLGLPAEHASWGTLINAARTNPDAWWLLVFPGICLLSLIWGFQHIGRTWEEKLRFSKRIVSERA